MSQSAPAREAVDQVQVGDAGEGAAVVPGDGEGGHAVLNTLA